MDLALTRKETEGGPLAGRIQSTPKPDCLSFSTASHGSEGCPRLIRLARLRVPWGNEAAAAAPAWAVVMSGRPTLQLLHRFYHEPRQLLCLCLACTLAALAHVQAGSQPQSLCYFRTKVDGQCARDQDPEAVGSLNESRTVAKRTKTPAKCQHKCQQKSAGTAGPDSPDT